MDLPSQEIYPHSMHCTSTPTASSFRTFHRPEQALKTKTHSQDMSMHEEHERTIEENGEMEQNRNAWTEGLATGAIRFYRRGWRVFEVDETERGDARPGVEASPDERLAVSVDDGQQLQATGGAEPWRSRESGGAANTTPTDRSYARSLGGREDEPKAASHGRGSHSLNGPN
ncbi:hypothetical protein LTR91_009620 [Friedmanniomyces endolithicus]|uniref:Uncharacterized protein n=1 Tax=Friedmanniomyces endolithicus TaxID=329885 RepID=A0AAN6J914_9PEZI|nr:hypothetical protein LTS09_017098 [Friedmanniomyces endolithicus]KAK0278947.1 hypothetical protein LTS00_013559 [Friedmanniomyces endolithicus]KAK0279551.1 hypothetical protein LTR35_008741 [Friedmanniomyces endolithicus]KAK0303863.1 hypothetical protein LTR01_007724 [Friedmanniomyces endolithicus]KAK0320930.1 hypothetical protein LTR82_008249 [Friedmanniomyces endolithicus]